MSDRRIARATRLLDPVWHQLRDALDRLYAEIEPGAVAGALTVMVENPDGTTISYAVMLARPQLVARHIITDVQSLVDALADSAIDATVEEP
jgi:hypothetical protein